MKKLLPKKKRFCQDEKLGLLNTKGVFLFSPGCNLMSPGQWLNIGYNEVHLVLLVYCHTQ